MKNRLSLFHMKNTKKLFDLVNTHGYPLSMALEQLRKARIVVSWAEFIVHARKAGWSDMTTRKVIESAIMEAKSFEKYQYQHGGSQCQTQI